MEFERIRAPAKGVIANVQNPKAIKSNFISKVNKPIEKAKPNTLTKAVNLISSIVCLGINAELKALSLKSSTIASTKNITIACIKSLPSMRNMPRRCREYGVKW